MSYTTIGNVQAFLRRDITEDEELIIPLLIKAVDSFLDTELEGSYGNTTPTTKYYDGGERILNIDPARDITKVAAVDRYENELFTYELNSYFECRPRNDTIKRWIEKRDGCFPKGIANIAVTATFTLGDTIPDDLKYLATYLIVKLITENITGDLKSESIEGYSRTFKDFSTQDDTVRFILNQYIDNLVML